MHVDIYAQQLLLFVLKLKVRKVGPIFPVAGQIAAAALWTWRAASFD